MISYNNTTRAFLRLSPPTRLMHCIYVRNTLKHAHKLAHGIRIQYIILFHLKNVKRTNHRRRSSLSCIIYSKPSSKRWSSQDGFSCHSSHANENVIGKRFGYYTVQSPCSCGQPHRAHLECNENIERCFDIVDSSVVVVIGRWFK